VFAAALGTVWYQPVWFPEQTGLILYLISYLLVGGDIVWSAVKNIVKGRLFDEFFLMSLATVGAFAVGAYPEAVAVMLFFKIGEIFQEAAVARSRSSIRSVFALRPDFARVVIEGRSEIKDPAEVAPGQNIQVWPGERVPLDGVVVSGSTSVDASALTGESRPRHIKPGQEILSGMINSSAAVLVRVEKRFVESTVSRILQLVESASECKAPTEQFITSFARIYTPAVVLAAMAIAFGPPLAAVLPGLSGLFATQPDLGQWVYRGLIFLVISCPCALVVSIPLGFFGGIGAASRQGVLVKGANFLEGLNKLGAVVWDKTGTLTQGGFTVTAVRPAPGRDRKTVLELAAAAESRSNHPIAKSIREAWSQEEAGKLGTLDHSEEIPGHGVKAIVGGRTVLVGNAALMGRENVRRPSSDDSLAVVHVAVDGEYAGRIEMQDSLKPESAASIQALRDMGVSRQYMLTGDEPELAGAIAGTLGLDGFHAGQLPEDKVIRLEEIMRRRSGRGSTAFVGDGINDAPVLARADIGVAMGGLGSDAAIDAADIVLMQDSPHGLVTALQVAAKTRSIVWQNIVLALGVKGVVLLLGAMGQAGMWEAVFADVGVALLAILNAVRILR